MIIQSYSQRLLHHNLIQEPITQLTKQITTLIEGSAVEGHMLLLTLGFYQEGLYLVFVSWSIGTREDVSIWR